MPGKSGHRRRFPGFQCDLELDIFDPAVGRRVAAAGQLVPHLKQDSLFPLQLAIAMHLLAGAPEDFRGVCCGHVRHLPVNRRMSEPRLDKYRKDIRSIVDISSRIGRPVHCNPT